MEKNCFVLGGGRLEKRTVFVGWDNNASLSNSRMGGVFHDCCPFSPVSGDVGLLPCGVSLG